MNPRLRSHVAVFELNTSLMLAVLDDLGTDRGWVQPSDGGAGMPGIAVHVLDARNFLAQVLSVVVADPLLQAIRDAKRVQDLQTLPSPTRASAVWLTLSRRIRPTLRDLSDEALDAPPPHQFPVNDPTTLGAIAFLLQHEAYHIGQLAILRKVAGLPAIAYVTRPDLW
ncbi:MAG: DinB family protein [Gemmatimonadota bacterium]|nr:DinB family protein [Gemmatimonadota bacterium]MDH3367720.1 DinB family protein [Gemmatimonadota bacterium]MDH3477521.1 DinB family protein [Gemmatimonadota bacterium]MDH3568996.1 DinB family protein [Gemmatimonadota bacterium]MDH5549164.1 DinB family protein [Gemmatimonadota bacterium]